jgi:glycosyltransferase involved in cell wall biosynthesis
MPSNQRPQEPLTIANGNSNLPETSLKREDVSSTAPERPLVSIVLPAYNEASILREHVHVLIDYLRSLEHRFRFEFIIVNDGSRDETGAIAEALASEFDSIRVFHHRRNFGLGQALKTGFAQCHGQYVIVLDIDLSYGPDHVRLLLDRITATGARIVLASPYMRGGRVVDVPWFRVFMSRMANRFLARASGHRFSTLTCMVRAIDGRFLRSLHLRNTGMDVMPEMIHKAKILRASFEEVPAELNWQLQNRAQGRRSSLRIVRQVLGTAMSGFMLRPFTFLLIPGLLLLAFALYVNTWMIIHFMEAYAELGASPGAALDMSAAVALAYSRYPHTFIVGLLSLMLAIQLTGMAMLSLQNKKYFDELFHLGSTLLREERESRRDAADTSPAVNRDLSSRQTSDGPKRT